MYESRCCGKECNDGGFCRKRGKWAYMIRDDECPMTTAPKEEKYMIEHINSGRRYKSISECSKATGVSQSSISHIVNGKSEMTMGGQRFRRIGRSARRKLKKVRHIESGGIYENAKEVAEVFGTTKENVYSVLNKRSKSAKGQTFEYVEV